MDDDFNTGGGVGVMLELARTLNGIADAGKLEDPAKADANASADFEEGALAAQRVAVSSSASSTRSRRPRVWAGTTSSSPGLMQLVIELRNNLRAEAKKIPGKDDPTKKMLFGQTDIIRQRLARIGGRRSKTGRQATGGMAGSR